MAPTFPSCCWRKATQYVYTIADCILYKVYRNIVDFVAATSWSIWCKHTHTPIQICHTHCSIYENFNSSTTRSMGLFDVLAPSTRDESTTYLLISIHTKEDVSHYIMMMSCINIIKIQFVLCIYLANWC